MMPPLEKQIAALEAKIVKERAKLADAKAKAAMQIRKRDTRRKILFGYAFLEWTSNLPRLERNRIVGLVHAQLKVKEREAFPLREVLRDIEADANKQVNFESTTDPVPPCLPFLDNE